MKVPAFVWILLIIIVGFGGLLALSNSKPKETFTDKSLPVVVEVFSDLNCPHCADFEPYVDELEAIYGDKVQVERKNLPILTTGQANDTSYDYAIASEAARLQGKHKEFFTEMFKWNAYRRNPSNTSYTYSDEEKTLFQGSVDASKVAEFIGLDMNKYNEDINDSELSEVVLSQKKSAVDRMGPASTPAIFIYDKYFTLQTFNDLKDRVGEIITEIEG